MQYILTEYENNKGCELVETWETDEMNLNETYIEQSRLNKQGYYTVIHCTDVKKRFI